jgi:DNA-binding CsgD family transcriptional regulator
VKLKETKLLLILLFSFNLILSQELPPITNFFPEIYGAENQNWSISQSKDNYIYIANNSGLLEYNGAKWKLYPSPNNTILRSVAVINSKIYTGSYMEFGYWNRNEFGELEYTSLSKKIEGSLIEDEQFWNIIAFEKWILFQSLNQIYIYNTIDDSFKIITSKTNLSRVFLVENTIYFQSVNDGIYKIENGNEVLVSNLELLQQNLLVNIFLIEKRILFQTQEKGIFYIENEELIKWDIPANSTLDFESVYSSIRLKNGNILIGTISNGIFEIDAQGNILQHINQENGLSSNTILTVFEDIENNVWLGLDYGIGLLNLNSPIKVYNDVNGKLGTVYASAVFDNLLYLGTNQGLFYKSLDSDSDFKLIEGTIGQVWFLKEVDNTLFCGHNLGTFTIKGNKADLIVGINGSWDIKTIENQPNLLLQGNYYGLIVLEKRNNNWQFRNKIEGFDISSRYFEILENNTVFVSHEYKGVFKLKVSDDFKNVINYKTDSTAPKGLKSSLIKHNNNILYTCNEGIFTYNRNKDIFQKDSILSSAFLINDVYTSGKLIPTEQSSTIWGFTDKNVVYFTPGKLDNSIIVNKISLPSSVRSDFPGYESVTYLSQNSYLFGSSKGYFIIDLNKFSYNDYFVKINKVYKSKIGKPKQPVPFNSNLAFDRKENNLYFHFSTPNYDKFTPIHYQYKLSDLYSNWSSWTTTSEVSFENLPYGSYTFEVRAQIGNNLSRNTATFSFDINKPWFLSDFFVFIYILGLITILYLIHIFYKKYYSKQKQKMLENKQREFTLSQLESEKVIMKLKNEKLQNEIESKTRELAASTMNIIKKNELLNTIKNELNVIPDQNKVKPVIKIINNNITNNDDWKIFQEAFNNADRNFLKKVKTLHPNLTPNDLRLSAYLRLNLSSKEIAPLLNISTRSVEIKRYRLRKKMELGHEQSLVEYILSI